MSSPFLFDAAGLSPRVLARKHRLESDPAARTDPMVYLPGMENIRSDVREQVLAEMQAYRPEDYTAADVTRALMQERPGVDGLKALLSPAAAPFLEQMAQRAAAETARHFGNSVQIFTPLYLANYCENYCVYCGFNCFNPIRRGALTPEQTEREMAAIASSGMEEILLLTGESRAKSDLAYIGRACETARRYFRTVGVEIYPVNTDEYRFLHGCGAEYVTVFQETYDPEIYAELHLFGHKRVYPYRFDAQERALLGGMRGVAFSALLGLADFRRDALATALHLHLLHGRYPAAEMSLSCPRLRPIAHNRGLTPGLSERELTQILCAYRIFLPYAGITVSSRERAEFRSKIVQIAATRVSAGVSVGIGGHDTPSAGDEQFEISDGRTLPQMCTDLRAAGLQPVLNDFI